MRILRGKDYREMSLLAARIMAAKILSDPSCVLGLATGSTPIGLYDNLVKWNEEGILDFSKVTTVNLDEYKGLTPDNDQSYRYFMNTHLFDRVNIRKDHTFVPDGTEKDEEKACADYNRILEEVGPADIQLLGIGRNGHIGFNEPGAAFIPLTHSVQLTESTIEANSRFFATLEEVPKKAYTMGMKTILNAKTVLIVASGKDKAQAVHDAFEGPVTPACPASVLQLHSDVVLAADEDALSLM